MYNVPEEIKAAILKLKGLEICPNVIGQITVYILNIIIGRLISESTE